MTTVTTEFHSGSFYALTAPFRFVARAFNALDAAQKVSQEAAELFSKTDQELAGLGLTRDQIGERLARHFATI